MGNRGRVKEKTEEQRERRTRGGASAVTSREIEQTSGQTSSHAGEGKDDTTDVKPKSLSPTAAPGDAGRQVAKVLQQLFAIGRVSRPTSFSSP